MHGDGVSVQPCLGVGVTVELVDADWLEHGMP
jgi:hypothetical protein